MQLSDNFLGALSLHNAQRFVSGRSDGSWWLLSSIKYQLINNLSGAEHSFIIQLINSQTRRAA